MTDFTETTNSPDHYDSPWKEAIEHYFPEFMAFYFPDAYAVIDWSKEYCFLDQELRALVPEAELGNSVVDKLVQVQLLHGEESWLYIHVEVQSTRQKEFAKRMFIYNYRIFDRYNTPVASFAVLADRHRQWRPNSYGFEIAGCKHSLEFSIAKLIDYEPRMDELLASDNAFGLITAAHLLTQQTRHRPVQRYEAKLRLIRLLYERTWDRQRIVELLRVIDWFMELPLYLTVQIRNDVYQIEEGDKMPYVTSFERLAKAEGVAIGFTKGRVEGRVEGSSGLLRRQLERRFGVLPSWVVTALSEATEAELGAWGDAVLSVATLDEVFT